MNMDLTQRIQHYYKSMSKGQKIIAEYILTHYDKAAFMTASKLGHTVGVSESTVVRFALILGYEGYPKLQRALQELIRNKLTTVQRMELSEGMESSNILESVLKKDMNNIRMSIEELDKKAFQDVVESIFEAKNVYILGLRSSSVLAQFLGYYLNYALDNIKVVTSGVSDIFDQMARIGPKDLLICISFPRYATRALEGLKFAKQNEAQTVAITDSQLSPLKEHADICLTAHSDMASYVDSLVAPLSLLNALVVAVANRKKDDLTSHFSNLEAIWNQYGVYMGKDYTLDE